MAQVAARVQAHCDRLAKQVQLLTEGVAAGNVSGSQAPYGGWHFNIISGTDEYLVEHATITAFNSVDHAFTVGNVLASVTQLTGAINAMVSCASLNGYSTLSAYFQALGIEVSEYYNWLYYASRHATLLAAVVFPETDIQVGIASKAGGVWSWTADRQIGTGSGNASYSSGYSTRSPNFAPAQLKAHVINKGATNAVLTLTCLKPDGVTTESKQVTVNGGAGAGTEVLVGTSSNVYLDVTLCSTTGGSDSDVISVRSVKPRSIKL